MFPGAARNRVPKRLARAPRAKVAEFLATLASLGQARCLDDGRYLPG